MAAPTKNSACHRFGVFQADLEQGELRKFGTPVRIQDKPFRLLAVLLERPGEVVSREELRGRLWPADTFVEFDDGLNAAVKKLRAALNDTADRPHFIETVPKRGYRFVAPLIREEDRGSVPPDQPIAALPQPELKRSSLRERLLRFGVPAAVAVLLLVAGTVLFFVIRHRPVLTEKDTVLLADFANSTGDPVFDGTLRQGLEIELEQSPFLSLISDERAQQTLRLMEQAPDARITPQIAHDLCERTQSAAYVNGSIARFGSEYILGLKAVSCSTGDVVAEEQQTASAKENVLAALDKAAGALRAKLGESLKSVEKFHTPLEQATTPSLEALQAYTFGRILMGWKDEFEASIPFFQRATQLDPNFAMAHAALSSGYRTVGETLRGEASARRAYELRGHVTELERYYIEGTYFQFTTGDLERARQVFELSQQVYPRDVRTPLRLWQIDSELGQYEDALVHIREAIRLNPSRAVNLTDLVESLINLNRSQEARAIAQKAIADGLGSTALHLKLYKLAFLENDSQEMARQAASVAGKGNPEAQMLEFEADTAAYFGRLTESRKLSRLAEFSALREKENEAAAAFAANGALQDALFGNLGDLPAAVKQALDVPSGRVAQYLTALSLALGGDIARAQSLADDLGRRYPDDTLVRFNYLPAIRAQIALGHHDPSTAIDLLRPARPYELSNVWRRGGFLAPIYVRGEAYLMAQRGAEAATEFQKLLDHRGIVANSPSGALAHLQLGRANLLMGDNTKAKAEYREFLDLWKDADPDIPVLKQARAEYAKLK
ncbi:MAG TPA: winged helix-turn-helix domain-containing protein [Terracidiphilus sp.]|nr:winged helix-turn-helix domain-containing protein [Terracidiphilus sp.]